MSDYNYKKVLRVPTEKYKLPSAYRLAEDPRYTELFEEFPHRKTNCFAPAPTVTSYLDYVLECDYDSWMDDFGKVRCLTRQEKTLYAAEFEKIIPGIDMNDVRLVQFCWYNCTEAPDYYDISDEELFNVGKDAVFLPGKIHGAEHELYVVSFTQEANDGKGSLEIKVLDYETIGELYDYTGNNARKFFDLLPDYFQGRWRYVDSETEEFVSLHEAFHGADFIVGRDGDDEDELEFIIGWARKLLGKESSAQSENPSCPVKTDAVFLAGKIHDYDEDVCILRYNPEANNGAGRMEVQVYDYETILKVDGYSIHGADEFFGDLAVYSIYRRKYANAGTEEFNFLASKFEEANFIAGKDGDKDAERKFLADWAKSCLKKKGVCPHCGRPLLKVDSIIVYEFSLDPEDAPDLYCPCGYTCSTQDTSNVDNEKKQDKASVTELLPCPICGSELKVHGPEDWKPSFSDPDSGGDPYAFYCSCGYSFDSGTYDFEEAVTKANRRA